MKITGKYQERLQLTKLQKFKIKRPPLKSAVTPKSFEFRMRQLRERNVSRFLRENSFFLSLFNRAVSIEIYRSFASLTGLSRLGQLSGRSWQHAAYVCRAALVCNNKFAHARTFPRRCRILQVSTYPMRYSTSVAAKCRITFRRDRQVRIACAICSVVASALFAKRRIITNRETPRVHEGKTKDRFFFIISSFMCSYLRRKVD